MKTKQLSCIACIIVLLLCATHANSAHDPEVDLKTLRERFSVAQKNFPSAEQPLRSYLETSAEIIERLFSYIDADMQKEGLYYELYTKVQGSELENLVRELENEFKIMERNRKLDATRIAINLKDLGINKKDALPAIDKAIKQARSQMHKGVRIIVPPGNWRCSRPVSLQNLRNIIFEGQGNAALEGTQFNFHITARSCENIIFRNLTFDIIDSALPWTQGVIKTVNHKAATIDIELMDGYPLPTKPYFAKSTRLRGMQHDRTTGLPINAFDSRVSPYIKQVSDRVFRLTLLSNAVGIETGRSEAEMARFKFREQQMKLYQPGNFYVLHARAARDPAGDPMFDLQGEYITLDNITCYASAGHVFIMRAPVNGFKVMNSRSVRKPGTTRLTCANADGFHIQDSRKGAWIYNNIWMYNNDDDGNYYVRPTGLQKIANEDTLLIKNHPFRKGDAVVAMNKDTAQYAFFSRVKKCWSGSPGEDKNKSGNSSERYVQLDRKIPKDIRDNMEQYSFYNNSMKGDGGIVEKNTFGFHRANGWRIKNANCVYKDNIQFPVFGQAVNTRGHKNTKGLTSEGIFGRNLWIENNTWYNSEGFCTAFLSKRVDDKEHPWVTRNIYLKSNSIHATRYSIHMANVEYAEISDNKYTAKLELIRNGTIIQKNNKKIPQTKRPTHPTEEILKNDLK